MEFTTELLDSPINLNLAATLDDEIRRYIYNYQKKKGRNCLKGAVIFNHPLLTTITDNEIDEIVSAISVDYPFSFKWAFNLDDLVVMW